MQFPYGCFVIVFENKFTNQNITTYFAGVDYGMVSGFADLKNAKTFSTEIEAKQFFEKNKNYLMRKTPFFETCNPRIVRVTFTEDCKTKLE